MRITGLRGWIALVTASTIICAILGAAALAMRAPSYTSAASTSITADGRKVDPSVLQGLTATLFMMMPVYAEHGKSAEMLEAAANESGLSTADVGAGLSVERNIDSSVLKWTMTAENAEQATTALRAATDEFKRSLPETGPRAEGEPLLAVDITGPASEATGSPLTPPVGAAAGAAIGLLGGLAAMLLLFRGRAGGTTDWDEVEHRLGIPVVAELVGPESNRTRQWRFTADRLQPVRGEVGVFSLGSTLTATDVTALEQALDRGGDHATVSSRGSLDDSDGHAAQGLSAAVILIDPSRESVERAGADCRSLAGLVSGPTVGVLDRRRTRS